MMLKVGDPVVYQKRKVSTHPGPRAEDIRPAPQGEEYSYAVDKYWLVTAVNDDQTVDVVTRTGKSHHLKLDDPRLRKASWMERILRRNRFPDPQNDTPA